MTGQNERQTQILSGQIVILAEHCPVTGRYFESCD